MSKNAAKIISLEGNESAQQILKVAETTSKILDSEYDITITMFEAIPTIVEIFMQQALKEAASATAESSKTTLLNMFDMFQIGYDVSEDEDSEKGGNITPAFAPLGLMKTMGKDDETQSGE